MRHRCRPSSPFLPFAALTACLGGALAVAALLPARPAASDEAAKPAAPPAPEKVAFFEERVRPLLLESCVGCHGKDAQMGGLRLDSRDALLKGGDSGPAVVPGDPEKSLLIAAVRQSGKLKMPQGGKLPPGKVAALESWVRDGAAWGAPTPPAPLPKGKGEAAGHWAFRPVAAPKLPAVKNAVWAASSALDRFVLARLEAKGLKPSPEVDRRTLLRRVTYDLTGLPPTPREVADFVADKRPDAYERVVDRLLASPRYGERWARWWLDVARYADTKGYVFTEDRNYPNAYTYRDWVIDALNRDLPYDRFVTYQLAADRPGSGAERGDLAALGFLTVGRRFLNQQPDIVNDRIDVTTRGFLGLTVACARCHDHKFDPVPTQDYYSLYGVFDAAKETTPELTPASGTRPARMAMAMEDKEAHPAPARVFKRGNPGNPGDEAPRRFLLALSPKDRERPVWTEGSGRLELARAIASPENPLTARVLVNRVWQGHFGYGIVRTASDFGKQGERPTHPELLDWLTARFVRDGWSLKRLHRTIVLSRTYRQSSAYDERAFAADPENRLLWRQNRRRLDLEQTRDSLLAAAGRLDTSSVGGPSEELWDGAKPTLRRAVYGRVERQNLPGTFRTFDFASPDATSPGRFVTTVPQQALYFLNSPFVVDQARALAARPEVAGAADDAGRVRALYRLLFGRGPSPEELSVGLRYVRSQPAAPKAPPVAAPVWQYGWGGYDEAAKRVTGFTPFGHFTGDRYQVGAAFPDEKLGYLMLNRTDGHPGRDGAHAVIRRWVAPADGSVSVAGLLKHPGEQGDGVRGRIVHSRLGLLGAFEAFHGEARTDLKGPVEVRKGDTLDFVVDPKGGDSFDGHRWTVTVTYAAGKGEWPSEQGFAAPPGAPPAALDRWGRYAQALLMTDEFAFVD